MLDEKQSYGNTILCQSRRNSLHIKNLCAGLEHDKLLSLMMKMNNEIKETFDALWVNRAWWYYIAKLIYEHRENSVSDLMSFKDWIALEYEQSDYDDFT